MTNKKNLTIKEEADFWQQRLKQKKPLGKRELKKYYIHKEIYANEKKNERSILLNKGKKIINKVVVEKKKGLIERLLSIFKRK